MCKFSGKLIAWLDRELPVDEALEVELHLGTCAECQQELRTYERLSTALDAYCEAAMESTAPRNEQNWKPAALGAGAVAAVLALLLASPHGRKTQPSTGAIFASAAAPMSRVIAETAHTPRNSVIPGPRWHAKDLSSIVTEEKGDSPAKGMARLTVHSESALNVRATPAAAGWQLAEPAIQITIPAEAVLPPGAAPEGVSFVAEVSIAADGSAHQIFLQP